MNKNYKSIQNLLAKRAEKRHCINCQSTKAKNPDEWAKMIDGCNNCKVDIQMKGEWTGSGLYSFQRIVKMFPKYDIIWDKMAKIWGF